MELLMRLQTTPLARSCLRILGQLKIGKARDRSGLGLRRFDLVFHNGKSGESYNVSADNVIPNIELVKKICAILDKELGSGPREQLIQFVSNRPRHDRRYALASSKIRNVPLGGHAAGRCALLLSVRRCASPVPSARCQNRFGDAAFARPDANAIRVPSGDHTGFSSVARSVVRRVSVSLAHS